MKGRPRSMHRLYLKLWLLSLPLSLRAFAPPSVRVLQHSPKIRSRFFNALTPEVLGQNRLRRSILSPIANNWHRTSSLFLSKSSTSADSLPVDSSNSNLILLHQALEDCNLTAAVSYMRSNPTMEISRDTWSLIFTAIEERTARAEENDPDWVIQERGSSSAAFPLQSAARQEMTDLYQTLQRDMQQLKLFGAASTSNLDNLPVSGSHSLPPLLLEQILDLPMSALTPKPTNTLLLAGGVVAVLEILVTALWPQLVSLNTLVFLTVAFLTLDRIFINGAILESFLKVLAPGTQSKILKHEAGHFLTAYLLGCPVEGIVTSAWAALADKRFGNRQVSAGTSFFDPALSREINTTPSSVTRASIDRYSIIVMAGIAAEAIAYQRADGGAGDEMALIAFLSQLGGGLQLPLGRRNVKTWNNEKIRNQARWGAMQAVLLLREYKPAYDALVDALERGGSLGDCIYAIEKAAREYQLKPISRPIGWIVQDKDGVPMWSITPPSPPSSTLQPATTPSESVETAIGTVSSTPPASRELKPSEAIEVLQQYRSQLEEKLKTIEEQLNEMESS